MPTSIHQCFLLELNVKHFNVLCSSRGKRFLTGWLNMLHLAAVVTLVDSRVVSPAKTFGARARYVGIG